MGSKTLFLRWFLLSILIFIVSIVGICVGGISWINKVDVTKISFVIIGLFAVATCWCGYLTWKVNELIEGNGKPRINIDMYEDLLRRLELKSDHLWAARVLCTDLGLLGTIWGMVLAFCKIDMASIKSLNETVVLQFLLQFAPGISTAFVTTLIGSICGILIFIQCLNLCAVIDKEKEFLKRYKRDGL